MAGFEREISVLDSKAAPLSIEHSQDEFLKRRQQIERMVTLSDTIDKKNGFLWQSSGQDSEKTVKEVIAEKGPIPIRDWMRGILYGPDGYYTSGKAEINKQEGHFETTVGYPSHVYSYIKTILKELPHDTLHPSIVVVGSGNGDFERSLRYVQERDADLRRQIRSMGGINLTSIDISENLLLLQNRGDSSFILNFGSYVARGDQNIGLIFTTNREPVLQLSRTELQDLFEGISFFSSNRKIDFRKGKEIEEKIWEKIQDNAQKAGLNDQCKILQSIIGSDTNSLSDLLTNTAVFPSSDIIENAVQGDANNLKLPDSSIDAIFSNELHDALPPHGYWVDNNEIFAIHIGLDPVTQKFTLHFDPAEDE
jgi:hypothetical protein